jgi:RNA polymerase sigma-70 factor (ECF subfamily)
MAVVANMGALGSDILQAGNVPEDQFPSTLPAATSSRAAANQVRAEEQELVARCREGDWGAFETIYRRHSTSLYNLAYRMVGNPTDAEDLLQEVFLLVYSKLGSYQGQAALGTWLYRVATNRCLDHLRSRAKRNQSKTDSLDQGYERAEVATPKETTAERMDLDRCIAKLPDSYRAAFILYDVQGFEHREVAEILGVAEGTSKSLVHKARLKIRECLGQTRRGASQ